MLNLRAFARLAWNGIELAAHEVAAVHAYADKLVAARPEILELATVIGLGPEAKILLGGIELTADELEKIKILVQTFASQHAAPAAPPPAPESPPTASP